MGAATFLLSYADVQLHSDTESTTATYILVLWRSIPWYFPGNTINSPSADRYSLVDPRYRTTVFLLNVFLCCSTLLPTPSILEMFCRGIYATTQTACLRTGASCIPTCRTARQALLCGHLHRPLPADTLP